MTSFYEKEYELFPAGPFQIVRNCAGCGQKMTYVSTENFRVNANKNLLDVWLIYQCSKCRHSYNLPVYTRVKVNKLDPQEYESFLKNDPGTARRYGLNTAIFVRNRAEIAWDAMEYEVKPLQTEETEGLAIPKKAGGDSGMKGEMRILRVHNPYSLKVRTDRLAAELLQTARSRIKRMEKEGLLEICQETGGKMIEIRIGSNFFL